MSTDAQICYGIAFEEGFEFPWGIEPWWGDHEAWWRDVNGYESLWYPYTEDGDYKPGVDGNDPRVDEYHSHKSSWIRENPFPLTLVHCGSYDFSEVILAVTSTFVIAEGYGESFRPSQLIVHDGSRNVLLDFCRMWNIESNHPKWWLSTYRG